MATNNTEMEKRQKKKLKYSRTPPFRTRLTQSPRYFEGRSNALGFTLPLYASPVISKPRYFELFSISQWDIQMVEIDCTIVKYRQ